MNSRRNAGREIKVADHKINILLIIYQNEIILIMQNIYVSFISYIIDYQCVFMPDSKKSIKQSTKLLSVEFQGLVLLQ